MAMICIWRWYVNGTILNQMMKICWYPSVPASPQKDLQILRWSSWNWSTTSPWSMEATASLLGWVRSPRTFGRDDTEEWLRVVVWRLGWASDPWGSGTKKRWKNLYRWCIWLVFWGGFRLEKGSCHFEMIHRYFDREGWSLTHCGPLGISISTIWGERTREGNDLYHEMMASGVIKSHGARCLEAFKIGSQNSS